MTLNKSKNVGYFADFGQVAILLTFNKYGIIIIITYCLLL